MYLSPSVILCAKTILSVESCISLWLIALLVCPFKRNAKKISIAIQKKGCSSPFFVYPLFFPSYEPELFPGLIYRMIKPRIVLLIFVSGKVVLTGKYFLCNSVLFFFVFFGKWFGEVKINHGYWFVFFRCKGQRWNLWSIWKYLPHLKRIQEDNIIAFGYAFPILQNRD